MSLPRRPSGTSRLRIMATLLAAAVAAFALAARTTALPAAPQHVAIGHRHLDPSAVLGEHLEPGRLERRRGRRA